VDPAVHPLELIRRRFKGQLLIALTRDSTGHTVTDNSRLPGPVSDLWDWQLTGACRGRDAELFFHPEGERGPRRRRREAAAKAVCAACPVLLRCREAALLAREPYGVWGGLSEHERENLYGSASHAAAS
jgi:WhiB family redox-sensing transcriptional regulator